MENKVAAVEKKISSIENTLQDINSKLDVANKYKDDGKEKNDAFFSFQQDLLTQLKEIRGLLEVSEKQYQTMKSENEQLKHERDQLAKDKTRLNYRVKILLHSLDEAENKK
jgi:predicted nuclease with TOPRIM domain